MEKENSFMQMVTYTRVNGKMIELTAMESTFMQTEVGIKVIGLMISSTVKE